MEYNLSHSTFFTPSPITSMRQLTVTVAQWKERLEAGLNCQSFLSQGLQAFVVVFMV